MDNYDYPSPANSFPYMYHESESRLESSASASPMDSTYITYPGIDPSFEHGDVSGESTPSETSQSNQKPKRKRENRYKNAPPSVLSRRRAQNRASQRAYRERKDQRIKDLEDLLQEAHQRNDVLSQAYTSLQSEYMQLKTEQDMATAAQYHQSLGLGFDPTMVTPSTVQVEGVDMDLYLCDNGTVYNM
ncbi:hypothetical protein BKA67DRAFT_304320 [Truncatella angustata]|uniref:Putative transcription factor kapC n=1 Tax=Truncatella angustata TaxID=152316 RepID=A0A9P8UJ10_9PEZI|nr:uncharacterized protein BKA67DRAFT_304320 [Truncatella angustata]KAH6652918.1 hypothetical protein BKA67DRAFT_304320 [Truncatella angustata]KAH8197229.1 hypothetical protein TruAng_008616 [Truncatella angustata]